MTRDSARPSQQMSRPDIIQSALEIVGIVGMILALIGTGLVLLYGFEVVIPGDPVHGSIVTGGVVGIAGFVSVLVSQIGRIKYAN